MSWIVLHNLYLVLQGIFCPSVLPHFLISAALASIHGSLRLQYILNSILLYFGLRDQQT